MSSPIVRMYETDKAARDAVSKLREVGFPEGAITLVTPYKRGVGPSQSISNALVAGFKLTNHAEVYAEGVRQGHSLVVVAAPFGSGQIATKTLDSFGPMDTGLERPVRSEFPMPWDEAAPLSSALQWRPISRNAPTPLSTLMSFPTLSRGRTFQSRYAELTSSSWSLTSPRLLSHNATPLSSMFGLKTISGKWGAAWTTSFGLPLLSRNPAPLSSKLGLHLLTDGPLSGHPTPLSAILGLPTLSHGRSVLSRLFGELGSPSFALFGRNPLSRNAAPLSAMFGLQTLSGQGGASWTSSFGLPLLSEDSELLCTKLGLPMLSRRPAPLSSLFGLPVLSRHQ